MKHRELKRTFVRLLGAACLLFPSATLAQNNQCDEPGESPDVIVGSLHQLQSYGMVGNMSAFAVGTTSCNVGTCWLSWISQTNEHPVIGQNMYRLKDGRFEQIGQSWLKHGFFALSQTLCSSGCISTNGEYLGVNCSDPYSAALNGQQSRLGPRFEVDAHTGLYPYPATDLNLTGDAIYKRLQVHNDDIEPAQNFGARYFVEGQYVTADDAAAGNQDNNTSWREVIVAPGSISFAPGSTTHREESAILAWSAFEPTVEIVEARVPGEGLVLLGTKVTDLGDGQWRYEYAMQNVNSHRSIRSVRIPIPDGVAITNTGFSDVDYHSGEPWDGTDWATTIGSQSITFRTSSFGINENANALRWGTMYSFWFDADASPDTAELTIGVFRPGSPSDYPVAAKAPSICAGMDTDNDGQCDDSDLDDDNDGVDDVDDSDPLDAFACRDADNDTCDDCSSGSDDPQNDGLDTDGDGICNQGDTDDDNDTVDDVDDSDPLNVFVCQDVDADGCDDCSLLEILPAPPIFEAAFDGSADGFIYLDDTFRGTSQPNYASGLLEFGGGFSGDGLLVTLGGINAEEIIGMSGGWVIPFNLPVAAELELTFRYNLTMSGPYETDEFSEVLVLVDGTLIGQGAFDFVARLVGDGQGSGSEISTGWVQVTLQTGSLAPGAHSVIIGGYNNKKTTDDEMTNIRIDDVKLENPAATVTDGPDPANDGDDFDGDGACDLGDADDDNDGAADVDDCAPLNAAVFELPHAVGNNLLLEKLPSGVRLDWTPGIQGEASNIYAGSVEVPWSYNESCLASSVVGGSYDDALPAPGSAPTYYLISTRSACGESFAGIDSEANEHYGAPACP